ncbi:MAG: hypothetical protein MRERV_53c006 [Mycoplasmataceae bacterium RV_VA103A]|nr:MAG: hypothetical protein MRERV_53c006 [Mycoplasmataceae bacterium RV_VA103A]
MTNAHINSLKLVIASIWKEDYITPMVAFKSRRNYS